MHRVTPLVLLAIGSLACVQAAQVDVINFDAQATAMNAPSLSDGVLNSPLTIGIATFTGGELFLNESYSTDETGVYATASEFNQDHAGWDYGDALQITFSQPVSGFSVLVTNTEPLDYTVTDNLGGSETGGQGVFSLSDSGITSVTIEPAIDPSGGSDFAIDNVTFTPLAVPEPSLFLPLAVGLAVCFCSRKRALGLPPQ